MDRNEFLEGLAKSLSSAGSRSLINENIKYYAGYIEEEIRKGRTEAEVMEELGDPRLIANSIKEAEGIEDEFSVIGSEDTGADERFTNQSQRKEEDSYKTAGENFRMYRFGGTSGKLLLYGILGFFVLLFVLVILIVVGLFKLLSPVLLPILMVLLIMSFMRFFRNGN